MSKEDYIKAQRMGKRDYQLRMMKGLPPTLEVLDDILPPKGSYSEVPLGLVQIPMDLIVGTKTGGRSSAFAGNFMPILKDNTEFAIKWALLSTAHVTEGIREPVKAYEYMNKFYILEGNKRVSVMKYYDAVSIPGEVIRIIPPRTKEKENRIYFEFLDFYEVSKVNYIWFSNTGSFGKLLTVMKKKPDEVWTEEERLLFSSVYSRFLGEYTARGGKELSITPGDAFLSFVTLYGYQAVCDKTMSELKNLVAKSWEEFTLLQSGKEIDLKLAPTEEKKTLLSRILSMSSTKLKAAFIYAKTPGTSAWTYAHELGRLHLEQTFPDEVSTVVYENVTLTNIEVCMESAIKSGCNLVFTTSPAFAQASLKAAIAYPDVRILNCSLNTSHRYIRTYYARMHEAKFLMGAIAGAMAENNRLLYLEDYPIYGSVANINAFALGAKMINPRVKVYLEWTSRKRFDLYELIRNLRPDCISGKDMVIPEEATRSFGIYRQEGDYTQSLAMPLWHWGRFYELLIRVRKRSITGGECRQE